MEAGPDELRVGAMRIGGFARQSGFGSAGRAGGLPLR
jgi:hypothetical protein